MAPLSKYYTGDSLNCHNSKFLKNATIMALITHTLYYHYRYLKTVTVWCICFHSLLSFHCTLFIYRRDSPNVVECNERKDSCPFKCREVSFKI
jgi:hypothetical protein